MIGCGENPPLYGAFNAADRWWYIYLHLTFLLLLRTVEEVVHYRNMPITPEYTWAESDATIRVEVPLKGQPKSKVDIFGERKR